MFFWVQISEILKNESFKGYATVAKLVVDVALFDLAVFIWSLFKSFYRNVPLHSTLVSEAGMRGIELPSLLFLLNIFYMFLSI